MRESSTLELTFSEALEAGRRRDYGRAASLLESLAVDDINSKPEILLYLARSYHAAGRYQPAVTACSSYLAVRPSDGAGWFFLGRSYLAIASYEAAAACLRRSIELEPENASSYGLLGTAFLKLRKSAAAVESFKHALYIDADNEQLETGYRNALFIEAVNTYNRGDVELSARMFEFLDNNGMTGVMFHLYTAHSLRALGKTAEALVHYQHASSFAPDDHSLRWYEITALFELGKKQEALNLLNTVRSAEGSQHPSASPPDEKSNTVEVMKNALFEGRWNTVIHTGRFYISRFGSDPLVHSLMGEAARSAGRYDDAVNHFKKASSLDTHQNAPRYGLLMTYLEQQDWKSLYSELRRPVKDSPALDGDTVLYYSVICSARMGSPAAQVLPDIQAVFLRHPGDPVLMQILAEQYCASDLNDLAEPWYRRLTDLAPDKEDVHTGLIACCEKLCESARSNKSGDNEQDNSHGRLLDSYDLYFSRFEHNHALRRKYISELASAGLWDRAADQAEKLLPHVKNTHILMRRIAMMRRRAEDWHKAALMYNALLRENLSDSRIMQQYVFCLVKLEKKEKALTCVQLWQSTYGCTPDTVLIESSLQQRIGRVSEALAVLRSGRLKFPDDQRIEAKLNKLFQQSGTA